MKYLLKFNHDNRSRSTAARGKYLIALGILLLGMQFKALALQSPRGKELFGNNRTMVPVAMGAPSITAVRIVWDFPASLETPELIFKLYHSTNLAVPLRQWPLLTNIPGNVREVPVSINQPQEFFVLTASNRLGESGYATP